MALFWAALTCLLSGFALLALCRFPRQSLSDDILLRVSLSVGYGLGIFSLVFYLSLFWRIWNLLVVDVAVLALLVSLRALQLRLRPAQPNGFTLRPALSVNGERKTDEQWPNWFRRTLTAAFVIVLAVALYASVVQGIAFPHGNGWDAFAIWNLHARFLFLGGAYWRDGFTALVGGSHPDYPLLLPAAIAHFWTVLGRDDARIPAAIGIVITFATAGALFAALSTMRGRVHAMMGAIVLLATPFFIEQGSDQYADIPLSFFFLATVVLLCFFDEESPATSAHPRTGSLVMAGIAAGFAAWTKNEGSLFLLAIAVSRLVIFLRVSKDPDSTLGRASQTFSYAVVPLLGALVPGLLLVAWHKHFIGVPGDLFSDPATALAKLRDPARYWAVLGGYVKGILRFGHWFLIPGTILLAALLLALGRDARRTRQPGFRTSVLALALTLAGYFGVFLITPYDIHWHLRFSLVRLFLQLWPSLIFLTFLVLSDGSHGSEVGTPTR
jgi:hypothetical protein